MCRVRLGRRTMSPPVGRLSAMARRRSIRGPRPRIHRRVRRCAGSPHEAGERRPRVRGLFLRKGGKVLVREAAPVAPRLQPASSIAHRLVVRGPARQLRRAEEFVRPRRWTFVIGWLRRRGPVPRADVPARMRRTRGRTCSSDRSGGRGARGSRDARRHEPRGRRARGPRSHRACGRDGRRCRRAGGRGRRAAAYRAARSRRSSPDVHGFPRDLSGFQHDAEGVVERVGVERIPAERAVRALTQSMGFRHSGLFDRDLAFRSSRHPAVTRAAQARRRRRARARG